MTMIEDLSRVVRDVGRHIMEWRNAGITEGMWVKDQFKAKADKLAHDVFEAGLRDISPFIPVISEENLESLKKERPGQYWLIDPIDGTASFVHGFKGFVTQAALMQNNRPTHAVIFAPALDELYIAERGKGASLNGKQIRRCGSQKFETLIDNYPEPRGIAKEAFTSLGFSKYIECGSIALKICRVADGSADLFLKDVQVRDWDLAAPELVLEESGGTLTDISGMRIQYTGNYEHCGLIAAHEQSINSMIAQRFSLH
jgi:3'(2'), 5'-bisphosphate nucleotidase/myo-inositol-1(or 4)-monophosphatase